MLIIGNYMSNDILLPLKNTAPRQGSGGGS